MLLQLKNKIYTTTNDDHTITNTLIQSIRSGITNFHSFTSAIIIVRYKVVYDLSVSNQFDHRSVHII